MQEVILMACETCKRRNYSTRRTKRPNQERLSLKKFCKHCRAPKEHKEVR